MRHFLWKIQNKILAMLPIKTLGARALVIQENKVLLIKHSYINGWYTVGGGVERGESPLQAVQRELFEEVGIRCLDEPRLFNVYYNGKEKRDDYIVFYLVENFAKEKVSSVEVLDEAWFDLDSLPQEVSPATKRRIEEYKAIRPVAEIW
ncbi:NUDIX domain-containing protein [Legionella hackeliae]|uniref:Nudix hydrolase n=1 Tax=Legionella hackeliae TaxID=449 RepID=A0A0A8USY9_LEGHA|nr:NUDIX domain-containing protein [Legionella hackeliae]KTD08753.1 MutT/nudix family protein [Legionella hackeliae]CEK10182.1 Nudix hydrolase [Legionella hackeliae]STX46906.1 MutT/nudix family protein [Legionella hackeliae]